MIVDLSGLHTVKRDLDRLQTEGWTVAQVSERLIRLDRAVDVPELARQLLDGFKNVLVKLQVEGTYGSFGSSMNRRSGRQHAN
jgi:hypothetical protein